MPSMPGRPPNNALASGLAPWILFSSPSIPSWEAWWTRNRLYYLSFKEPIEWESVKLLKNEDNPDKKDPDSSETTAVKLKSNKKIIDTLSNSLQDDDYLTRMNTVLAMAKFRDKKFLESIKKALTDKNQYVRNTAILSLGIMGDLTVVKDLKEILLSSESQMISQAYAALALGYLKEQSSIDALKEVFNQKKVMKIDVKCAALLSLGNIENPSVIPFLGKILNDNKENVHVRAYAALALGRIKDEKALPFLKQAVQGRKNEIQGSVAVALGLIKSRHGLTDLYDLFTKSRDSEVKGLAALSLAKLGDKSSAHLLLKAAKQGDYNLGGFSILALGMLGDEKSKKELRAILATKNKPFIRGAAALALGMLKDEESVLDLIKVVEKEEISDSVTWSYAILALGMIGDKRAVPVLEKIFEKIQDPAYLNLANAGYNNITVALAKLGQRDKVREILHKKLEDKSILFDNKLKILHGIGYVGDETSIDLLLNFYNNEKNAKLRSYAVLSLGFILDKDKITPLYKIISDGNHTSTLEIIGNILLSRPD
ncbi:MAG: HEAT repeat domain-containing protein [Planctomycetota bacterium]